MQQEIGRISHTRTFTAGETVLAESEQAGSSAMSVSGVLRDGQDHSRRAAADRGGSVLPLDAVAIVLANASLDW